VRFFGPFALIGVAVLLVGGVAAWWSALPHSDAQASSVLPVVHQVAVADASAAAPQPTTTPAAAHGALMPANLVSPAWLAATAAKTGIPQRALQAYAGAAIVSETRNAGCHLGWNTLAGIGEVESAHGTVGGAHLGTDGVEVGAVVGPVISGGPAKGQQAIGPMQILPSTWSRYAVNADGAGQASPDNIDDAALAAADYLCVAGGDLSTGPGWTAAVHAYNPDDDYVAAVRAAATHYAELAS
jgi:membrane-bound lytic murein transglycosylase B